MSNIKKDFNLSERDKKAGLFMSTLSEDEVYAVQNFISGMRAVKEYARLEEMEKAESQKKK
jgi:hypothetical protein